MPDNLTEKWQRQDKQPISEKVRDQIVKPPPLRERLEFAKRRLNEEIVQLGRISDRLSAKDKALYDQLVKAYAEHDTAKANSLANELAELRKVESKTAYGKYALEKAYTKIDVAKEFGDMAVAMADVNRVLKGVSGTLSDFIPSTSNALGEISSMMNETLVSFSNISGDSTILGPTSEDAEKILQEAAAVAENRLKDKLPPSEELSQ